MEAKSFEEEMRLDQQQVNQTAWEQEYFFEENGFAEEDMLYEAEIRSQYWTEYMTSWAWCNAHYDNDSSCSPLPPKGFFDIASERIVV